MPEGFTTGFAKCMDKACLVNVSEAKSGVIVESGNIYIAPGGEKHMSVVLKGNRLAIRLKQSEKVNGHCPSVDVLFNSLTPIKKFHPVVIVLTGMGADGAKGMQALSKYSNDLVVQSEETCVVYGMPMVSK
jgi:two-component system chemotaxis response regulator CheB